PGAGVLASNVFQHVALTFDKASGVARLYRNGVVVAQQTIGSITPQTSYDLYLGRRPASPGGPIEVASFAGLLDEAAIYNRTLTTNEIQAIYNAGTAGKCTTPGVPIITVLSPSSGAPGTNVTITGNNFS